MVTRMTTKVIFKTKLHCVTWPKVHKIQEKFSFKLGLYWEISQA